MSSNLLSCLTLISRNFLLFFVGTKVGKETPFLIIYCECFISHEYDDALLSYTHKRISLPSMPPPSTPPLHLFLCFCASYYKNTKTRAQIAMEKEESLLTTVH